MYNTPPNVCLKFEALYICLIWKHNAFDQRTYDKEKEIFLGKIKIRFFGVKFILRKRRNNFSLK